MGHSVPRGEGIGQEKAANITGPILRLTFLRAAVHKGRHLRGNSTPSADKNPCFYRQNVSYNIVILCYAKFYAIVYA
jgi:hypothetical protein